MAPNKRDRGRGSQTRELGDAITAGGRSAQGGPGPAEAHIPASPRPSWGAMAACLSSVCLHASSAQSRRNEAGTILTRCCRQGLRSGLWLRARHDARSRVPGLSLALNTAPTPQGHTAHDVRTWRSPLPRANLASCKTKINLFASSTH